MVRVTYFNILLVHVLMSVIESWRLTGAIPWQLRTARPPTPTLCKARRLKGQAEKDPALTHGGHLVLLHAV